ncbi:hypothetical protein BV898_04406 [Hypsibius exemplaris]|uniref:Uncharacterized protein n=1 Tax=Hypsibius exemplaris TaxID=2072580 RepID=A0A1W0X2R9_HYPEX|nr:hypothetical protein BV898_04406 [Hypsibius exemplaris]
MWSSLFGNRDRAYISDVGHPALQGFQAPPGYGPQRVIYSAPPPPYYNRPPPTTVYLDHIPQYHQQQKSSRCFFCCFPIPLSHFFAGPNHRD